MPKFSIIIPTYNESQNLPLLLSDLSNINSKDEIIIIDANSKDKTRDITTEDFNSAIDEVAQINLSKFYNKLSSHGVKLERSELAKIQKK